MRQAGNLAIVVCARQDDVSLQILNGKVSVFAGHGPDRASMSADWRDDNKINEIIHELNYGKYQQKAA